jgi:hypothetical protein
MPLLNGLIEVVPPLEALNKEAARLMWSCHGYRTGRCP